MIMKKIYILITGVVLLLATSCNDYLKEENLSYISTDKLYETADGYEGLVNSCYSSLRDIFGGDPWLYCAGTDMYVEGMASQPEGLSEYKYLVPSDGYVSAFYENLYKIIQLNNTAIYYNDKTEKVETLEQRKAEVRFLRALAYFKLVQHFGGVGIVTEMIDKPVVAFERNSAQEVYDFIISELENILPVLPETTNEYGRATKRAVNHYLAKVYLTRGYETFGTKSDFDKAANYAEAAINGQGLTLSFEEVFTPGNEENEEVLFSVQYGLESMVDVSKDGNKQNLHFGPRLGGSGNEGGYPYRSDRLICTMYVINLFTEADSRWEATFMTQIYKRYYDYYDEAGSRDELYVDLYYPHTWQLADTAAWRAASPYRANAVIIPYGPLWDRTEVNGTGNREALSLKKFDDPKSVFSSSGSSTRDVILARLSETYLIAAEAYLKAGNTAKAADMINVVRTRAAKPGHAAEMQLSASEMTIDKILDERALELAGEYHRWEDLKRTGTLIERTKKYNRDIKDLFDIGNPFMGTDGELKILRPIPQEALDLNQNDDFPQNPGY